MIDGRHDVQIVQTGVAQSMAAQIALIVRIAAPLAFPKRDALHIQSRILA